MCEKLIIVNMKIRSWKRKLLLAFLLLILAVSLILNISFILKPNKRWNLMKDPSLYTRDHTSIDHEDTFGDNKEFQTAHQSFIIDVLSNRSVIYVKVNGNIVFFNNDTTDNSRGIHVVVLNQATPSAVEASESVYMRERVKDDAVKLGILVNHHDPICRQEKGDVMSTRYFDTYLESEDALLVQFVETLSMGRILVLTIKDEGTFNMKEKCRRYLSDLGSQHALSVGWRDTWAFITVYGGRPYGEMIGKSPDFGSWGEPVHLKVNMTFKSLQDLRCLSWPKTESTGRRRIFCAKYEGYKGICRCDNPAPIDFKHKPLPVGGDLDVAVSVIASNRPHYLFRMLKTLLQTPGVPVANVTVFIDGFYDEARDVAQLFNIKGIQHTPHGVRTSRISQHYKGSILATFELFPNSEYIILIEEDLDVSPDFFYYFKQTLPLLKTDPTLFCISAWNDQGYEHSSKDPTLLYRIETMPGLGWMMKKSLFMDELLPQWPAVDQQWDWDMWMRTKMIRKDRECVIPDISRTYHFGSKGLNVSPFFQKVYFANHKLQSQPNVKLKDVEKLKSTEYELLLEDLIKKATLLNHSKNPCVNDFIPKVDTDTCVMYIYMNTTNDYQTWNQIAKCYKLWDLDVRGFHKSMWRLFYKDKHLIIVGAPASPYAKFKPGDVKPIYLEDPNQKEDKPPNK